MSGESLGDRLGALSRAELIGLVALVAVTVGGAGLWYVRSLPKPVTVVASGPGAGTPGGSSSSSPSPSPAASVLVHVAGWVRSPGVYEFHEGDRVIDAVQAAGGPRKGADLNSLNLAAPLTDGTQVIVPQRAPANASGAVVPSAGSSGTTSSASPGATVNVNTADATALATLPGIGDVLSQRIIDYRTQNGPFASVDDLEKVSGIGPSIMAEVRDMVTV